MIFNGKRILVSIKVLQKKVMIEEATSLYEEGREYNNRNRTLPVLTISVQRIRMKALDFSYFCIRL